MRSLPLRLIQTLSSLSVLLSVHYPSLLEYQDTRFMHAAVGVS
jgi:hypothetical protein